MILSVQKLQFRYPGRSVLKDINFNVEKGECLAILGTNGTGKSTLLKCLNRILKPQVGTVIIDDEAVSSLKNAELAQKIGYVEQQKEATNSTVFDAVLLGRKPYIKWDLTERDMEITQSVLKKLGLTNFAMRYLDELSGGEVQKVVIARALAQEPKVLLMDEPTSSLDLKNQMEVLRLIKQVVKEGQISAIVTMHDLNLALRFADKFILLKDGKVYAAGGAEILTSKNIETVYSVEVKIEKFGDIDVVIPL